MLHPLAEALLESQLRSMLEPVGESILVDLNTQKHPAKATSPAGFKGDIGEKVEIKISKEKIHIFDKRTEELL